MRPAKGCPLAIVTWRPPPLPYAVADDLPPGRLDTGTLDFVPPEEPEEPEEPDEPDPFFPELPDEPDPLLPLEPPPLLPPLEPPLPPPPPPLRLPRRLLLVDDAGDVNNEVIRMG